MVSEKILKNISDSLNDLIRVAKKRQPRNLEEVLKKFKGRAEGVAKFNCNEPPNCWSLVIITLTSIAITLPKISSDSVKKLLSSVSESLIYIRQIEETLYSEGISEETKKAVDCLWLVVELQNKWLDEDVREIALKGKSCKENLDFLVSMADKVVADKTRAYWPLRVIAANSMDIICRVLSLDFQENVDLTDEKVFTKISVMIADTIASCLTNLPHLIIRKCHSSFTEKREESVKAAARLLGETEEILGILHQNPSGDESSTGNITSSNGSGAELHIDVE